MKFVEVLGLAAALGAGLVALSWWRGGSNTGTCTVCPLAALLQAATPDSPDSAADGGAGASSASPSSSTDSTEASHAKDATMSCCPGASENKPSAAPTQATAPEAESARSAAPAGDAAPNGATPAAGERPLPKTEAEWRKRLTPEQYRVLRQKGTERAFTGKYDKTFEPGVYRCAGCGAVLFSSDAKYDSGCGWPAFYEPLAESNIETQRDLSHGMVRTEVLCKRCGGHLGHVFNDGPQPTGLRYCINSASLDFDHAAAAPAAAPKSAATKPDAPTGTQPPAHRGAAPSAQHDEATDLPAQREPTPRGDSGPGSAAPENPPR